MIPDGYIIGMGRNPGEEKLVSHLYKGTHDEPGYPMCARGWNRSDGERYSILRGNVSDAGVCQICLKRALNNLPPIKPTKRKTRWI